VNQSGDGGGGIDLRLAGGELTDRTIGKTVGIWEERGEAWDGDVLGEQVTNGAWVLIVGVPDVGLWGELSYSQL
jgi:hypothetical protein